MNTSPGHSTCRQSCSRIGFHAHLVRTVGIDGYGRARWWINHAVDPHAALSCGGR